VTATLVIDCGGPWVVAAMVDGDQVLRDRRADNARTLASLADSVLGDTPIDLVAVTVGPGSFTGLRTGIALAHGIAAARAVPLVAVATAEALAHLFLGSPVLAAFDTGRGSRLHVQLVGADGVAQAPLALEESALPGQQLPPGLVVAGPAAARAAARLLAVERDVQLADVRAPGVVAIAAVAAERLAGRRLPLPPLPLYVDPAEARVASGLRPPPA
jgi:tRNA threonylcarbamoyladenosine biosynthesis protein TsaB